MIKCAECSNRIYRSPQLERQHETNIWEGLPFPLQFYIAVFHFKRSYCNYNLVYFQLLFCSNLLLLCQHFACCLFLPVTRYPTRNLPIFFKQSRSVKAESHNHISFIQQHLQKSRAHSVFSQFTYCLLFPVQTFNIGHTYTLKCYID